MMQLALMLIAAFTIMLTTPLSSARAAPPSPGEIPATPAVASVGMAAPDFSGTDSNGKVQKLSNYKGKTVVLEWTNDQCPFVRKFYDTKTMQDMQKDAADKGVIWLTVVSSANGKQGYTTPEEANKVIERDKSAEAARILDPEGTIGRLYGATNTPQMFVINADGVLVYAGAMDDQPSVSHSTIKTANNYVKAALDDLAAGKPVQTATSKPYGCGVKY